MLRTFATLSVFLAGAANGQNSAAPSSAAPHFEVASIKPGNDDPRSSSGINTGHGRIDARNVTLRRCILGAYGVGPHQISGGPEWMDSDRFQILAKAEQPVNDDLALMAMLQTLLAERFKLLLHRETRTVPALVLEVAKNGPKLEKAEDGEAVTNVASNNDGINLNARHTDLDSFARILSRSTDVPVVNRTAVTGFYNFKLRWSRDTVKPVPDAISLFTAIQEQLGLRLRAQKAPVEILVIDHVEKPSEN